jgi:Family of unknown function (DUF5343)
MITDTPPYGPADRVIETLEKFRETGFGGKPITPDLLGALGMGYEVARRVVLSLRLLDLIDDDGNATNQLTAFKQAATNEYRTQFASLLLKEYEQVFALLGQDLDSKTLVQIEDCFRSLFRPDSLRKRQVTLFLALAAYAGLMRERPQGSTPKQSTRPRTARTTKPVTPKSLNSGGALRDPPAPPPPPPPDGTTAVAQLESGGTVRLVVSVNLVDLSPTDRNFVFDLIDKVKAYGNRPALPVGSPNGEVST